MDPTPIPSKVNDAETAVEGSCLCGDVVYKATTLPVAITVCHCIECQKASGNPFLTFGLFRNSTIRWYNDIGEENPDIKLSWRSDMAARGTCGKCGTPLFMKYHARPDGTSVTMGLVNSKRSVLLQNMTIKEHIFLKERVPWWPIPEDLRIDMHQDFNPPFQKRLRAWKLAGKPRRNDV